MDPSLDVSVDADTLPKGRELPLLILFDSGKQQSLKKIMQLTINRFVKEDESLIIATRKHKNELEGQIDRQCQILDPYSLSGIESQWMIVTAQDQFWRYETLSRARNGLVILMDISHDYWYVFLCCCHVSCAYSYCFS